jgi:four helix bundle protein
MMDNKEKTFDIKKRAYRFSVELLSYLKEESERQKIFYFLTDQLLRSGTSIGANIVEAKSASSTKDFIRFYEIALKSANESKYWLCLFRDTYQLEKDIDETFLKEVNEISKILASSILKLKKKL